MKWAVVSCILAVIIIILIIRQVLSDRELSKINKQIEDILSGNTNALITVSGVNKKNKKAASLINDKLLEIRKKELSLEGKNSEITKAITNISHDLRTPLTSICGYSDMIDKSDDISEIKKYNTIIASRADAMKKLTEELFGFSMITDGKKLEMSSLNLNNALEESLAANYILLTEKGITPEIEITQKAIVRNLDKDAVSRIFGNIISNAAKYSDGDFYVKMDDGGEISFSNTARNLSEVSVSKLFDRFYTVSDARMSTGIGLSIAKTLTEKMGGKIRASYKEDKLIITVCF